MKIHLMVEFKALYVHNFPGVNCKSLLLNLKKINVFYIVTTKYTMSNLTDDHTCWCLAAYRCTPVEGDSQTSLGNRKGQQVGFPFINRWLCIWWEWINWICTTLFLPLFFPYPIYTQTRPLSGLGCCERLYPSLSMLKDPLKNNGFILEAY